MILRMIAISMLLALAASAQDAPPTTAPPPLIDVPRLDSRLTALGGNDALAYFELAEEVAAEIHDERGVRLARTLYVLAYELSRKSDGTPALMRSVCLALAELEPPQSERARWLSAVASLALSDEDRERSPVDRGDATEAISIGLSAFTAEDYLKARTQLGRPHALRAIAALRGDDAELLDSVLEEIESGASCEVCKNKRTVRNRESARARTEKLCPRCQGNPGPRLRADRYNDLLLFEVKLLDATPDTWAAQLDLDGGAPLREADPDQLPRLFGIDAQKTRFVIEAGKSWRSGVWVEPAGG